MAVNFQKQIRDNTLELHEFLNDLQNWEQSIKERDKKLKSHAYEEEKPNLLPVRGRVQKTNRTPVKRVQDSSQSTFTSVSGMNKRKDESNKDGNMGKSTAASHIYCRNKWDKLMLMLL